jgi:IS30 family transposase
VHRRRGDPGRRLSDGERREIQERVAAGATHAVVAQALGCSTKTIQRLFVATGGLPPRMRVPSPLRLSLAEREEISRGLRAGDSRRAIAGRLGRAPSTVARDVAPNGGRSGYRAWRAERRAIREARRPKVAKLARCPRLRAEVERRLAQRWSPQQIAHRLRLEHPAEPEMRVSHETIYRSLFVQARGALRRELTACLRTGRAQRRPQGRRTRQGRLLDMVLIAERPAEAADRAVPGHWEGDLLLGRGGRSAIGSVVERRSRYVLLLHLPEGRTAEHVRRALAARMATLPEQLRRTLTWDQGKEMAEHVRFRIDTGIPVYFCDPRSPWQRPTSENTNGLLRQYFPKGTDLERYTQRELDAVARELNGRPRQTLDWRKPSEVFAQTVATTG